MRDAERATGANLPDIPLSFEECSDEAIRVQ
jgi:hypothetical protein